MRFKQLEMISCKLASGMRRLLMPGLGLALLCACQAGFAHHAGQRFLVGEHADAFGQIAVAVGVTRDRAAGARQHRKTPFFVERFEHRDLQAGELEAEEAAAGCEDAAGFAQDGGLVGAVA